MKPFRAFAASVAVVALSVALAAPFAFAQTPAAAPAKAAVATAAPAKAAAAPAASSKSGATGSIRTIVGEVVDPACWVVNGAKGEAHKECLLACAKAGQVLAILEAKTNKLYLIATENPGEDPNKGVIDYAAQKVTVTGKFYTRGGVTAVKISSITPGGGTK
jgi:hypothetical protein